MTEGQPKSENWQLISEDFVQGYLMAGYSWLLYASKQRQKYSTIVLDTLVLSVELSNQQIREELEERLLQLSKRLILSEQIDFVAVVGVRK